jgi:hypothetical protein
MVTLTSDCVTTTAYYFPDKAGVAVDPYSELQFFIWTTNVTTTVEANTSADTMTRLAAAAGATTIEVGTPAGFQISRIIRIGSETRTTTGIDVAGRLIFFTPGLSTSKIAGTPVLSDDLWIDVTKSFLDTNAHTWGNATYTSAKTGLDWSSPDILFTRVRIRAVCYDAVNGVMIYKERVR